MRTRDKLAGVLREAGLHEMAIAAAGGYYDDFESPIAMPITKLIFDLHAAGREDLAARAMNGEWDATEQESEEWAEKEIALRSPVGEVMARMGLGKKR